MLKKCVDGESVPMSEEEERETLSEWEKNHPSNQPAVIAVDPVSKLRAFLAANPDVVEIL